MGKLVERAEAYNVRRRKCVDCGHTFKTTEHVPKGQKAISVLADPQAT